MHRHTVWAHFIQFHFVYLFIVAHNYGYYTCGTYTIWMQFSFFFAVDAVCHGMPGDVKCMSASGCCVADGRAPFCREAFAYNWRCIYEPQGGGEIEKSKPNDEVQKVKHQHWVHYAIANCRFAQQKLAVANLLNDTAWSCRTFQRNICHYY